MKQGDGNLFPTTNKNNNDNNDNNINSTAAPTLP